ncbi:MAG: hypothetical protein KatS3mg076_1894 [Candidatus Binatia bacterium]|nr:MAG: hypothetical protein KatS3mg076_1894 [Candidatus Binatia bacterium]
MKVTVQLHAQLKKFLPPETGGRTEVEVPDGATVAQVIERLGIPPKHAGMTVSGDRSLEPDAVLADGAHLDVFPPLAGGLPAQFAVAPREDFAVESAGS